jgi:hypothetical protein
VEGTDEAKRAAFAAAHATVQARLMAFLTIAPEVWADRATLKMTLDRIGFIESEDAHGG